MPWSVHQDDRCPASRPWAVTKDDDDELEGCHATKAAAAKQQAALYASEESSDMTNDDRSRPPRDNLVRAWFPAADTESAVELRNEDDDVAPGTLYGHFARFNEWTKIDSVFEGTFMERIAPGAFRKTFSENRGRIRITLNHGHDPELGDKPIATPETLREDEAGPYYEAPLLEGVPRLVVSGLRAGQYGASFRFRVTRDDFDRRAGQSEYNPEGLPERTIKEVELFEFGPVTYPAYAGATAQMRSLTDDYLRALIPRDDFIRDLATAPDTSANTYLVSERGPETLIMPNSMTTWPNATITVAPSVDAGAAPHLEPERREPEPIEPVKEIPVDYITRDEKVARIDELQVELTALASEYTGVMPDEPQARWDAATKEQDALKADVIAYDTRMARVVSGKTVPGDDAPKPIAPPTIKRQMDDVELYDVVGIERHSRTIEERDLKFRDHALRVAEQLRTPSERYDQNKSRERLGSLVEYSDSPDKELARRVLVTNSPQYRNAFNRYVLSGGEERGTALAVGVDGTGGYAVPVAFDPTVIAIGAWTAINPYRAACRVVTIVGTDTWEALTATAITAAYASEAAAATEQGPTFARPSFVAKRAHAFVTASYEMAADRPDLAAELGTLFGEAKDTLEENQFSIGVGTTVYPQGMGLKDAYTRVDSATNDTVAVGDIRAVEAALPIRHRMNAAWFLSRAAIRAIQAFETTGGQLFGGANYAAVGNPVSRPNGNTGLTLLGYPIWETPSMPWTPTVDDTTWGVLCNPQTYVILDRVGMSVRVIPDMLDGATPSMPTGEIGIYAFWRGTARVLDAGGGRQGAVL